MPISDLRGKAAVITGAASGIGFALATRLAHEGMRVLLADVEQEPLQEAVDRINATGATAIGLATDVRDAEQVQRLADRALEEFGGVALLCNNAGVNSSAEFAQLTLPAWQWVMDVNFFGVLNGCRAFLPILQMQPESHIVNTGSSASFWAGTPTFGAYAASKFAVLALSESLAMELEAAGSAIGISLLAPGAVRTRITESERNLPAEVPSTDDLEASKETLDYMREYIAAHGMEPATVADLVVDAVHENTFYVLTHPDEAIHPVQKRLDWMTRGINPTRS